jgi:hypothetical protein
MNSFSLWGREGRGVQGPRQPHLKTPPTHHEDTARMTPGQLHRPPLTHQAPRTPSFIPSLPVGRGEDLAPPRDCEGVGPHQIFNTPR